tara:strand:- start:20011 stop:20193 length:183 start_codon:yes stop_codon:yes gene_type:complete
VIKFANQNLLNKGFKKSYHFKFLEFKNKKEILLMRNGIYKFSKLVSKSINFLIINNFLYE